MDNKDCKLALGTVQFGIDYGIANTTGQVTKDDAFQILECALANNVTMLDTASLYGASEAVLGGYDNLKDFKVVTKTKHFGVEQISAQEVQVLESTFAESVEKLQQYPYGLLIHNADDLLKEGGELLFAAMQDLKQAGKVTKIGVSVYSPAQCREILKRFKIDLVQLPMSIFDQRFLVTGVLDELKAQGVEIHVRSVFLQGLLLMDQLPEKFSSINIQHSKFTALCNELGVTKFAAAMSFIASLNQVDRVVVGVNNLEQFEQLTTEKCFHLPAESVKDLVVADEKIVNPSKW